MDINTKILTKNAYRVTKERYKTCLRVRVPGGRIEAKHLSVLQDIAENYGEGDLHLTTRQGFEIPGIDVEKVDEVNKKIQSVIEGLEINQVDPGTGYPAAGTRNVSACIGNRVCPKGQYETSGFAKRIEDAIFPNNLHVKIALTGCPNDCIKARMHDFGIIGMTLPEYDRQKCISCKRCVTKCKNLSTEALKMENYKIVRDHDKCIGCGECVLNCPTGAWTRNENKYYRLAIMGRTGKKNPRLAEDFILWADEESVLKIILNTYEFVEKYIDRSLPKEHIGYIVDRVGFKEYREWALKDVNLPELGKAAQSIYWQGIHYKTNLFM